MSQSLPQEPSTQDTDPHRVVVGSLQPTTRPRRAMSAPDADRSSVPVYVEGVIHGVVIRPLRKFADHRGWLAELYRDDELSLELHPAMAYVSETEPGITRGPHEHVDQTDYFAFLGPGNFELYLWDARRASPTYGQRMQQQCGESSPSAVIIPPGVVHAYKNVSRYAGWVFNAPNRLYAGRGKKEPVDEIRHEDQQDSPFQID